MAGNETFTETNDAFVLGHLPIWTEDETIVSGAGVLAAGTVLGKITSGGKFKTALDASSDGSETPAAILAVDVDATSADVVAPVYKSGLFDSGKLTIGAGLTAADVKAAFEGTPLFVTEALTLQS